jgi:bacterial/archaeal transporter family-2 protein
MPSTISPITMNANAINAVKSSSLLISILLVQRLGTATFVALLVTGQMLSSLVVDQYGLLGVAQHPAHPTRIVGAALLVLGVVLIRR